MPPQYPTRPLLVLGLLLGLQAACATKHPPRSSADALKSLPTKESLESISENRQLTVEEIENHITNILKSDQLTVKEKIELLERTSKETYQTQAQIYKVLNKFIQAKLSEIGFISPEHDEQHRLENYTYCHKHQENKAVEKLIQQAYTIRKQFCPQKARHPKEYLLQLIANNPAYAHSLLKPPLTPLDVYLIRYALDHACFPPTKDIEVQEPLYAIDQYHHELPPTLYKDKRHLKPYTYKQTVPSKEWQDFIQDLVQGYPLHVAIDHGLPTEVIEGLLQRGAKVDYQWRNQSPLALAITRQATPAIQCLVKFIGQHSSPQEQAACYRILLRNIHRITTPAVLLDSLRLDQETIQAINSEVVPAMIPRPE
ncbi:MAG: hypothetical protein AAF963_02695 [Bacteroidota bacterium]